MAEERDQGERTEEPTARRLTQAREEGQTVQSREVATALLLAAAALFTALALPTATPGSLRELAGLIAASGRVTLTPPGLQPEVGAALLGAAGPWLGVAAALGLAALLGPLVQGAVVLTGKPLVPKLERLSPIKGLGRLFSADALLEFAKGLLKLGLIGGAAAFVGWSGRASVAAAVALPPGAALADLGTLVALMLAAAAAAAALVAALDHLHQRHKHRRQLRMTRQELKEEMKESDGDPLIRQRLRAIRMERARRRMMADMPKATVVLTNPTHVAVALRYASDTPAPVVVAKGYDEVAAAIRERAATLGIPLVSNPPLARALAVACEPGEPIPIAHYEAVAQVIAYLMRLERRQRMGEGR